ncbi:hypothetical protein L873DRAFT_1353775 [Choiromyces venosus 120613-1]|uniref:Uncharacterized protein n=1 Tax=Choiromyces venosus 120613-1 TaxID=1336337 RepID=A0A3N4KEV7_9PEZI|nr:hypothetical protein L873DRAFT_1353775 [Choiromyces venosus 120613-1]
MYARSVSGTSLIPGLDVPLVLGAIWVRLHLIDYCGWVALNIAGYALRDCELHSKLGDFFFFVVPPPSHRIIRNYFQVSEQAKQVWKSEEKRKKGWEEFQRTSSWPDPSSVGERCFRIRYLSQKCSVHQLGVV